jgi:penicillin amidase
MKIVRNVLIATPFIVAMALGGTYLWLRSKAPVLKGSLHLKGLQAEVEVYFDGHGIPHIYAASEADAYRVFGYLHAQDRLFQMELMRRAGLGCLAEVLGPELIGADRFFRTMGTHLKARSDGERYVHLPEGIQTAANAYIDGINAFLTQGNLPPEFAITSFTPEPFTPTDLYAVAAYMSYSFDFALRTDPLVHYIGTALGPGYLRHFSDTLLPQPSFQDNLQVATPGSDALEALLRRLPAPVLQGSNNWALAPTRSAGGRALLANDTHIKFTAPGAWYEAHIEYPGTSIYGNFLAGIPFALVGHTRVHGWGITMFENDDTDFYIEQWAAPDSSFTLMGDTLHPVQKRTETIRVKGKAPVQLTVYETRHGPVMNEFINTACPGPVAMQWTYLTLPNELLEAFHGMNYADGLPAFRESVKRIGAPGLNIVYADIAGDIARWSAAHLPIRPAALGGKHFADGSNPAHDWLGYHPWEDNPQVENPAEGFVYSANQHWHTTPTHHGYYAPDTRARRIVHFMEHNTGAAIDDMRRWVLDVYADAEHRTARELCDLLHTDAQGYTHFERACFDTLSAWDGHHHLHSTGPVVYYKFLYHLLHMTMADELGESLFTDFLNTHELLDAYPRLIADADSPWWDDVRTEEPESRADICRKAFAKCVDELETQLGTRIERWSWGEVHTITHEHALGSVPVLRDFFNIGPFTAPGGHETVNNASFRYNPHGTYKATFGPAMRILIDFADVENAWSVLPTGNSGNVMSPHYSDQAHMFLEGRFRKMMMNRTEIEASKNRLIFQPAGQ